ncbi:MAG: hypothetical protein E7495_03680 [Ruminococcus flavefaciens]|jgi:uncharacterized membrane protein HdeD (DUF308 family)|nr:hypothetical protein [Ruminococcus flavefaciens]
MKISNSDYIAKGLTLIISGVLIGFFPNIIAWIFYIIGGIIVLSSVFMLLGGVNSGMDGTLAGSSIAGIIIGVIVLLLPRVISVGIPIVAGIVFIFYAISRLSRLFKSGEDKNLNKISLGFSLALLAFGIFLLFRPFAAGNLARIIIGIIMILLGVFNFYVAHMINKRNKDSAPDIIDV